ncbi:MAG: Rrf2 family transcriptional regulator [Spirochaetes bacterium]|nr:Rrf2 family transcriptional regulator [Spirochaetota bacterium]
MKLTTKSEYTILALIHIARNKEKKFIKIDEISDKYNIPKKYLEHLMMILKQNRILKAKRGSNGGYMLSKKPEEISMAEVIRLMDGALAPTESVSQYFYSSTPLEREKKVLLIFKDIRDYISNKLENSKLSDLI